MDETAGCLDLAGDLGLEPGAYTRPLLSSTWAISDTKYTLNTPRYSLVLPATS